MNLLSWRDTFADSETAGELVKPSVASHDTM